MPTKSYVRSYVDSRWNDPSIIRDTAHVDFNDKSLNNVRLIKVNSLQANREHLTPTFYVDEAIYFSLDKLSLSRLDPNEKLNLKEQDSIILNSNLTTPKTIIELPAKSYVESLHEIIRNRRDLSSIFYDQDNEFNNNKLNNLDSVTINKNPRSDKEVSNKKHVDDSIGEGTLLRFNQTLDNYLKVSIGNDTYNLTKYNKVQIIDTTEIKFPNIGSDLLQKWNIKCNNKNNDSKVENFIKSNTTKRPTRYPGETNLPPIGSAFMYLETSSNNHGHERVFVSFERTDIFQTSKNTFYQKRFSNLTNDSKKSMGRFRIQLLLEDNTRSTRYNIPKNDRYCDSSTDWT